MPSAVALEISWAKQERGAVVGIHRPFCLGEPYKEGFRYGKRGAETSSVVSMLLEPRLFLFQVEYALLGVYIQPKVAKEVETEKTSDLGAWHSVVNRCG